MNLKNHDMKYLEFKLLQNSYILRINLYILNINLSLCTYNYYKDIYPERKRNNIPKN